MKRELPEEITPAIKGVLSLMVWRTGGVAEVLRYDGHEIELKSEEEQAYVLFYLLKIAIDHGDKWRDIAHEELKRITRRVKGQASQEQVI